MFEGRAGGRSRREFVARCWERACLTCCVRIAYVVADETVTGTCLVLGRELQVDLDVCMRVGWLKFRCGVERGEFV